MKVTEVKVRLFNKAGQTLKAFADITIDGELVVKGLKVVEGAKGDFVSFPSTASDDGKFYDNVFPITKAAREEIVDAVLDAYDLEREKESEPKRRARRSAE